jgi:hypothetical protein
MPKHISNFVVFFGVFEPSRLRGGCFAGATLVPPNFIILHQFQLFVLGK